MMKRKLPLLISALVFLLSSCHKNEDYFSSREDIKGSWKLYGIYKYDLKGNVIDIKKYNLVWNIGQDSIQATQSFGLGNVGTGVLKQKFEYFIYPNRIFQFGTIRSKIKESNHETFIFSLKRPDHVTEFVFYSVDE